MVESDKNLEQAMKKTHFPEFLTRAGSFLSLADVLQQLWKDSDGIFCRVSLTAVRSGVWPLQVFDSILSP